MRRTVVEHGVGCVFMLTVFTLTFLIMPWVLEYITHVGLNPLDYIFVYNDWVRSFWHND